MPDLSIIIPTHNPEPVRLQRTLRALRDQSLPAPTWETIVIDNVSVPPLVAEMLAESGPPNLRLLREPELGLSNARRRGLREARAPLCVFVDDDNLLAPDYLKQALRLAGAHPRIGAFGGKSLPEFESTPPAWTAEFFPLLALRNHGERPLVAAPRTASPGSRVEYPLEAAPIGAGMVIRREAAEPWLQQSTHAALPDRRGAELSSAGDNDIVLTMLRSGWDMGYFPELLLTHVIPTARLAPAYLARLNHDIQHSWMRVLTRHKANPWPPIRPWSVPLRQLKAWFAYRAWSSPAARIRWQGACGHFEGRRASPGTS